MTDRMDIRESETGLVRVFHLDLPPEAIERYVTQAGTGEWPLKYGLGASRLRNGFVDVIDLRDLGRMPLSTYLQQAHGVTDAALQGDRARLDALTGHVIALPAQAFDNTTQTLTIQTPLRHLGTYSEIAPSTKGAPLRSASARGTAAAGDTGGLGQSGSNLLRLLLIGIGILILVALILAFL